MIWRLMKPVVNLRAKDLAVVALLISLGVYSCADSTGNNLGDGDLSTTDVVPYDGTGDLSSMEDVGGQGDYDPISDLPIVATDSSGSTDTAQNGEDGGGTPANLSLLAVLPGQGSAVGYTTVTLSGTGFDESCTVRFGDRQGENIFVLSQKLLNVSAPPHTPGVVDLTVTRGDGSVALINDGFRYLADLVLGSVSPDVGTARGGTPVVLSGAGFSASMSVLFGGRLAVDLRVVDDSFATVVSPPGEVGPTDVTIVSDAGRVRLESAFTYENPDSMPGIPGFSVLTCSPHEGPVAGGTEATIVGTNFVEGDSVVFGGVPGTNTRWISPTVLRTTTPKGSPGEVDVVVSRRTADAVLKNGYKFVSGETKVLVVEPASAAWSGGGLIRIFGVELGEVSGVYLGGLPASDVVPLSSTELVARVPRTDTVGLVDVVVLGLGGGDIATNAFTYFDPALRGGGTWGGPIGWDVNVTVYGPDNGRLPKAYVILGADQHTPLQGYTDNRGQITFSDFGLGGPVTVHANKVGNSAYTIAGFDARNATIYLGRSPSSESPGLPPSSVETDTCIVTGRVLDYGKYFIKPAWLDGEIRGHCTASKSSLVGSAPSPGPDAVPDIKGRFSVTARDGEFALICSIIADDARLGRSYPLQMGIVRHLKCIDGDIEGVELTLSNPTDSELSVDPGRLPTRDDSIRKPYIRGGFELGDDGYIDLPDNWEWRDGRFIFDHMPRAWDGDFAGDGFGFYTQVSANSSNGMPYAVTILEEVSPDVELTFFSIGPSGEPDSFNVAIPRAVADIKTALDGVVMIADSGGSTYEIGEGGFPTLNAVVSGPVSGISAHESGDLWAVGEAGGVWRRISGSLERMDASVAADLRAVDGPSADDVTLVGNNVILHWYNETFHFASGFSGLDLYDVKRFGDSFVAGGVGGALAFGTIGEPVQVLRPVEGILRAVDGTAVNDVWLAGDDGVVAHFTGSGLVIEQAPTTEDFHGVVARGPCDVVFFGTHGAVFSFDCDTFTDRSVSDSDTDFTSGALDGERLILAGRTNVQLPKFLDFPEVIVPMADIAWTDRTIEWMFREVADATHSQLILSDSSGLPFWVLMTGGDTTLVTLPDFGGVLGVDPIPEGLKRMNITSIRTPNFSIDGYTSTDLGYYDREAFSVNLASFE